ncbi:MAG: selenoneine biosynthesis selenosugar synthase SenB [Planctomycetota bacterium]
MNIRGARLVLVIPPSTGKSTGNRVTAERWIDHFRALGADASVEEEWRGGACDVLVALHATKSLPSIERFLSERPGAPLVVALGGTDVYGDLAGSGAAQAALARASRIVVFQPLAAEELAEELRERVRTIPQGASPPARSRARTDRFEVLVLSHLRSVKDPLLPALAAWELPPESEIEIVHAGALLDPTMRDEVEQASEHNPRYTWLGEVPHEEALVLLSRARLFVLPSRSEGGANVMSEALAVGVPVLATRIPGSVGLLGADHPGLFPVGEAEVLAKLMSRAETDDRFLQQLEERSRDLGSRFTPNRERGGWARLFAEL